MEKEHDIIIKVFCKLNGYKYLGTFESDDEHAFCKMAIRIPKPEEIKSIFYSEIVEWVFKRLNSLVCYSIEYYNLDEIEDAIDFLLDKEFNLEWNEHRDIFCMKQNYNEE